MEKRIASVSTDPHSVSLTDRPCSVFIDPTSGAIFVDEGDGAGRMNGAVFSPTNRPMFIVQGGNDSGCRLVLNYVGTDYHIGDSDDTVGLQRWVASANSLIETRRDRVPGRGVTTNGSGNGRAGESEPTRGAGQRQT